MKQNQTKLLDLRNLVEKIKNTTEHLHNRMSETEEERILKVEDAKCKNTKMVRNLEEQLNKAKKTVQD